MSDVIRELEQSARKYKPVTSANERKAYAAAHRILQLVEAGEKHLVCPGAILSRRLDRIADEILKEFEK